MITSTTSVSAISAINNILDKDVYYIHSYSKYSQYEKYVLGCHKVDIDIDMSMLCIGGYQINYITSNRCEVIIHNVNYDMN